MAGEREQWLARTVLALADTLGREFDLASQLADIVACYPELVEGSAAGGFVLPSDRRAKPTVAATAPHLRALQRLELGGAAGPGLDASRTGRPIVNLGRHERAARWPGLVEVAGVGHIEAVHAFPLRHRGRAVGAVTLYCTGERRLDDGEVHAAQTVADAASIGLVQAMALADLRRLADQLQVALDSRVAIEQAKGVLAERLAVPVEDAFSLMRRHARNHRRRLDSVAQAVVHGTMSATELQVAS